MARQRIAIGDVFEVPLAEGVVGYGQVVAQEGKGIYHFALFGRPDINLSTAGTATKDDVAFLALSYGLRLTSGAWRIIGNAPVSPEIELPAYKVGMGDDVRVEDVGATRWRKATPAEAKALRTRKTFSVAILEDALTAQLGHGPWFDYLDDLKPDWEHTTAKLFAD